MLFECTISTNGQEKQDAIGLFLFYLGILNVILNVNSFLTSFYQCLNRFFLLAHYVYFHNADSFLKFVN